MKKLLAVCTLSLSFLSVSALAETFHGVVSDEMCAKSDVAKAGTAGHADCAKKCIGMGSPAVLVVGTKVFKVSNPDKLNAFAGKAVTVDGSVAGDVITVASVKYGRSVLPRQRQDHHPSSLRLPLPRVQNLSHVIHSHPHPTLQRRPAARRSAPSPRKPPKLEPLKSRPVLVSEARKRS